MISSDLPIWPLTRLRIHHPYAIHSCNASSTTSLRMISKVKTSKFRENTYMFSAFPVGVIVHGCWYGECGSSFRQSRQTFSLIDFACRIRTQKSKKATLKHKRSGLTQTRRIMMIRRTLNSIPKSTTFHPRIFIPPFFLPSFLTPALGTAAV